MNTHEMLKRLAGALFFLLSGVVATPAFADITACVTNNSDLVTALYTAQSTVLTIKVMQGNYDLKNTVWHNGILPPITRIRGGSQLLGGYTDATCTSRNIDISNTTITDSIVGEDGAGVEGNLTVEGITFSLAHGRIEFSAGQPGAFKVAGGSTVLLSRDAFLNGAAGAYFDNAGVYWLANDDSDGLIRIVDSVIAGNAGTFCTFFVQVAGGNPKVEFINNTVVDNAVGSSGQAAACFYSSDASLVGNPNFYIYNNIVSGTTGTGSADIYLDTNQVDLENNIFSLRSGVAPIVTKNNFGGDPQIDVFYKPIIVPQSPAINSGNNSPEDGLPSTDLDGGPRKIGSIVDRGAYESIVDPSPTQIVTTAADNDSAGLSLRTAITSVNSNGGGTIKFNIAGGCAPQILTISSAKGELPGLVANATINGYTQSGATVNTLDPGDDANICVILEAGAGATPPARGLVVSSGAADSVSVTIEGLAFSGFSTTGIDLQGGSEHSIVGNHFGGSVNGHALQPNGFAVRIAAGSHDNSIGSDDIVDRNIIGDALGSGVVVLNGSTGNQILGNYIGLGWNLGTSTYIDRGNGARGIYIAGNGNTVSGNLIGDNAQAGIVLDSGGAFSNVISSNFIGADAVAGGHQFGNGDAGIHLIGDSSSTGDAPQSNSIRLNVIEANSAQGVRIDVGQQNRIRRNMIYNNTLLGIDLAAVGVTDDDDAIQVPDYANRGQNFPVITKASGDKQSGTVTGTLKTTPSGDYTVDFYISSLCNSGSGFGEGEQWLTSASVHVPSPLPPGDQGIGSFSVSINAPSPAFQLFDGAAITATTTDVNGNTSEFSACVLYSNDGIFGNGFEDPAT